MFTCFNVLTKLASQIRYHRLNTLTAVFNSPKKEISVAEKQRLEIRKEKEAQSAQIIYDPCAKA
jgi:hypothetical protein